MQTCSCVCALQLCSVASFAEGARHRCNCNRAVLFTQSSHICAHTAQALACLLTLAALCVGHFLSNSATATLHSSTACSLRHEHTHSDGIFNELTTTALLLTCQVDFAQTTLNLAHRCKQSCRSSSRRMSRLWAKAPICWPSSMTCKPGQHHQSDICSILHKNTSAFVPTAKWVDHAIVAVCVANELDCSPLHPHCCLQVYQCLY